MGMEMQMASLAVGLMGAQQQKKAYELEARSALEQAETAEMQAMQEEASRREQLRRQLASLSTSMSAQGVALGTSGSEQALRDDEMKIAATDISNIKLMGASNRRKYEISAAGSKAAGNAVMTGAFTKTASSYSTITS